ncbi:grass carp reovirus (GCRV)-induced gene 2e [Thunnus albacares]|uniref:grass carp reovirus (GCRV)-induced gene 2e n=1 Tax=Thunnus albacares TaxID=8236 RepID=UPI001CF629B6|nr:grass carp reovirus (GCRV)-induced gene 2e [Thunnus albacares]
MYQWAEDDFTLPEGVGRLGLSAPADGKKYVMYHGTTRANAQAILASGFCQSTGGMLGPGVYLSRDLEKASRYPIDHPEHDKVVIKVSVNVGKVIAINYQGHPRQKNWHDPRYGQVFDTAWVPPGCGMVKSGLEEDCVWDPNRIKILRTIKPRPVQLGYGAWGYMYRSSKVLKSRNAISSVLDKLQVLIIYNLPALRDQHKTGDSNTETNMYQWAEDDFTLPEGVGQLGLSAPADGKKYVMYHGTTRANAQAILASGFRQSKDGMLGPGVYLSRDLEKASRYPIGHPEHDRVVIKVSVNVGKVIRISYQGHLRQKTWHDPRYGEVYDTAWVPPKCGMVPSGLEEDCVWDPNRITIISTIKPRLVQPGYGAWGYINSETNMYQQTRFRWAEDDFTLPEGVGQLGLSAPVDGRKYVMYHGTTSASAQAILASGFRQSTGGMLGPGIYLSRDLEKASRYPIDHPEHDRVVIKVSVNVGRVIAINYQGHPRQKNWHDPRYGQVFDTAWVPPGCGMVKSGLEEDCVWDPNRIKILRTIKPRPVQPGYGAGGYMITINKQGHERQRNRRDPRYGPVYDTAWVPPRCGMVKSGLEEDCVWDPS